MKIKRISTLDKTHQLREDSGFSRSHWHGVGGRIGRGVAPAPASYTAQLPSHSSLRVARTDSTVVPTSERPVRRNPARCAFFRVCVNLHTPRQTSLMTE